ncbi:MAG TPA: hypothetical protein DEP23_14655 [Ruminococcaceae bacterium]|nr:hypothetical protein [Ruminiclostridium sp.]HCA30694.1 hypothetical protein [Oscillospiraceae bacterium]
MEDNKYLQWLSGSAKSIYWYNSAIGSGLNAANGAKRAAMIPFLANPVRQSNALYCANNRVQYISKRSNRI